MQRTLRPARAPKTAGVILVAGLTIAVVGLTAYALVGGVSSAPVLALAVVLVIGIPFLSRVSLTGLTTVLVCGAVLTSSWDALKIHGLGPADALTFLAGGCLVMAFMLGQRPPKLPAWISIPAGLLVLSALLTELWKPSANYLLGRYQPDATLATLGSQVGVTSNSGNLLKFMLAFLLLPALIIYVGRSKAALRRLGFAWLAGCVINGLIVISDQLGYTHVSTSLLGFADVSGRQAGLSTQANVAALAMVLCLPIAVWCASIARPGRRVLGLASIGILLWADYLTGSRGGLAVGVILLLVAVLSLPPVRRSLGKLLLVAVPVLIFEASSLTSALNGVISRSRLSSNSALTSDSIRADLGKQALLDFQRSPLHGVGLFAAEQGHNVYLQVLAATGLIGAAGMLFFAFGAVRTGFRLWKTPAPGSLVLLARACTVTFIGVLVLAYIENSLLPRFMYLAPAMLAALASQLRAADRDLASGGRLASSQRAGRSALGSGNGHDARIRAGARASRAGVGST
jgi:O-antigen ligase